MNKGLVIMSICCFCIILAAFGKKKLQEKALAEESKDLEDSYSEESDDYEEYEDDEGDGKGKFNVGQIVGSIKDTYVALPQTIKNKGACEAACNGAHMFNKTKRNQCKSKCK